jgi:hypothetical protein
METVKRFWVELSLFGVFENLLSIDVNKLLKSFIAFLFILAFFSISIKYDFFTPLENFKVYELDKNNQVKAMAKPLNFQTYSFANVPSSFGSIELDLSHKFHTQDFEKIFLSSFPKRIRKRVKPYAKAILKVSEKYQIDPFWVASIMWTESHFNWKAKSIVGAKGLMQIMPATKNWLYWQIRNKGNFLIVEKDDFDVTDYYDFEMNKSQQRVYKYRLVNIELGIIYLKRLLNTFNGDHKLATVAYNMGPGWTLKRLKRNKPVGTKNIYLDKVKLAYQKLSNSLWQLPL